METMDGESYRPPSYSRNVNGHPPADVTDASHTRHMRHTRASLRVGPCVTIVQREVCFPLRRGIFPPVTSHLWVKQAGMDPIVLFTVFRRFRVRGNRNNDVFSFMWINNYLPHLSHFQGCIWHWRVHFYLQGWSRTPKKSVPLNWTHMFDWYM